MLEFGRILVGLELDSQTGGVTQGSRQAADQARWVAKTCGASIRFLHSIYDDELTDAAVVDPEAARKLLPAGHLEALEAVVAEARADGIEAELDVRGQRAWIELVRCAVRGEADLVVVGKRNEQANDGRKLGSVASKLLRKCPAPVWVVKPDHDLVHRLVMAASDLSPVGDRASRLAALVARDQGCELHLVHAYTIPMALQLEAGRLSDVEYGEKVEELRRTAAEHLRASVADLWSADCKELKVHVGKGAPAGVIREAAAHLDPDLLVMGSISHTGLAGHLLGSTAERLLDRLDCSILAIKPEGFVSPVELER